jgi:hypothetical protein
LKPAGAIFTFLIFAFWAAMNSLVYLRQEKVRNLDQYRRGMTHYLGSELFRECWMGVHRKQRRIGHTGYVFNKVFTEEGGIEVHSTVEAKLDLVLLGRKLPFTLHGDMVADEALKPITLRLEASSGPLPLLTITGRREGEKFLLTAKQESLVLFQTPLDLESLHLGNGLVPILPISDFKVGDRFEVPCFDPLSMKRDLAIATVMTKEAKEHGGFQVDVYLIETRFREMTAKSWVTPGGELLRQEFGPPFADLVLRRESREDARRLSGR